MGLIEKIMSEIREAWRPPPKLTLSQWADEFAFLSAESSADEGRWRTLPYQKEIMDAMTDPTVERITVMKSARIGYTKMINHFVGYHIHQDPCSMMVVQPTIEDAEGYSKEEIAPMIRDTPVLTPLVSDAKSKDSNNTILSKKFPGGTLSMVGANSARGFRRVSRRAVIFDETDGYPASAGSEGDQIKLGIKRTEYYWNRKIIEGSTPLIQGTSRIEKSFLQSDQRRRFVPCPHCNHMQYLKWPNFDFSWKNFPDGEPEYILYKCESCRQGIEHHWLRWMDERGEYRPTAKGLPGHVGFHIWAAYSYSPNATWKHLVKEFLDCKDDTGKLQTWVNTWLGETWVARGDAPEWEKLYRRREKYPTDFVPNGVYFLTAGVDVQDDRLCVEVVGWGKELENWSIAYRVLTGKTSTNEPWDKLEKMLSEMFIAEEGPPLPIRMMAVDSGFNTQFVYNWVRKWPMNRVIAVKGQANLQSIYGIPKHVDVTFEGKRITNGLLLWHSGVSIAKSELYGWLKKEPGLDGKPNPPGFCHFPQYNEEYFKELTAEQLVIKKNKQGFAKPEWTKIRDRNEALDCRILCRVAASIQGVDQLQPEDWEALREAIVPVGPIAGETASDKTTVERRARRPSNFL